MDNRIKQCLDQKQQAEYPEHAKLQALQDENRMCGDWLTYGKGFQMGPKALTNLIVTLTLVHEYGLKKEEPNQSSKAMQLCKFIGWWAKNRLNPYMRYEHSPEKVLAKYYGIDLQKLDDEKRAMLKVLQEANQ